jgi:hypothetical protein
MVHLIASATYLLALSAEKLPQGQVTTSLVTRVMQFIFALAGAIAMLVIVISGFRYSISRGDPGAIKTAKESIIYAIIGMIIAISGYGIVTFVFGNIKL